MSTESETISPSFGSLSIRLTSQQALGLAREFANTIRSQVIGKRLAMVGDWPAGWDGAFREMQAAIRSIPDDPRGYLCSERRQFLRTVKYYLDQGFKEQGMPRRWQDWVAKVREVEAERQRREQEVAA